VGDKRILPVVEDNYFLGLDNLEQVDRLEEPAEVHFDRSRKTSLLIRLAFVSFQLQRESY
jgi:hypothetical protein